MNKTETFLPSKYRKGKLKTKRTQLKNYNESIFTELQTTGRKDSNEKKAIMFPITFVSNANFSFLYFY